MYPVQSEIPPEEFQGCPIDKKRFSSMTFSPGVKVHDIFVFNARIPLEVQKKETDELTYKLSLTYLGSDEKGQVKWNLQINDQTPVFPDGRKLRYLGSKKFDVEPSSSSVLQIEETDESATERIWIDLTKASYQVSNTPILQDTAIEVLEEAPKDGPQVDEASVNRSLSGPLGRTASCAIDAISCCAVGTAACACYLPLKAAEVLCGHPKRAGIACGVLTYHVISVAIGISCLGNDPSSGLCGGDPNAGESPRDTYDRNGGWMIAAPFLFDVAAAVMYCSWKYK